MNRSNGKRNLKLLLFGIYLAFILISAIAYIAENELSRGKLTNEYYESHLVFPADGDYGHYKNVVLYNKNLPGKIDLKYTFDTNTLLIERAENIKELEIDCKLMYENKFEEVFEDELANYDNEYYKTYFKETNNGVFTVIVNSDKPMEKLKFINAPIPKSVLVDYQKIDSVEVKGEQWWGTETYYTQEGNDITISYIPSGSSTVTLIFKKGVGKNPIASFTTSDDVALLNNEIYFDGSDSFDEDGEILHHLWDFGDGTQGSKELNKHTYTELGNFTVTLTVRDNDYLENSVSKTIYVVRQGFDYDSDGVPNEIDPKPYLYEDTDSDGLSDEYERVFSFTDPGKPDTDGDGWDDGEEVEAKTDPNNPKSHPKDAGAEQDNMLVILIVIIIIIIILILAMILRKRKKPTAVEALEEEPEEELKRRPPRKPGIRKIEKPPIMRPVEDLKVPAGRGAVKKEKEMLDTFDDEFQRRFKPLQKKMPRQPPKPGPSVEKLKMRKPPIKKPPVMEPITRKPPKRKPPIMKPPVRKPPVKGPSILEPAIEKPPAKKPTIKELLEEEKAIKKEMKKGPTIVEPSEEMPAKPPKPKIVPLKPRIVPLMEEESPAQFREDTIKDFMRELKLGRATAELLFDGGFASVAQLKKASKRGLMTVKGVGPKMANKIIKTREKLK